MNDWEIDFTRLLRRKAKIISHYSYNVPSRRIEGYMGGETEYSGFRAAILYLQLSSRIDLDIVHRAIYLLSRNMARTVDNRGAYAMLFLNDEDFNPIQLPSMVRSVSAVNSIIHEYYSNYAIEYEKYSNILKQLFPRTSKEDLCVLFHNEQGVSIGSEIIPKVTRNKRNWISICAEKNKPVLVRDGLHL